MRALKILLLTASMVFTGVALSKNPDKSEKELIHMANALVSAQRNFDTPALERLLAIDYVEISPLGQVDHRAEIIKFYGAEARAAASGSTPPKIVLETPQVDVTGEGARLIAKETMQMSGSARSLLVTLQFRRLAGQWRIHTAQYTPIREKSVRATP